MTNQQRANALALARAQGLTGHAILRWLWPDEHGQFNTGLPAKRRAHANAHECNFTRTGPSDRVIAGRVARGKRAKPAYL